MRKTRDYYSAIFCLLIFSRSPSRDPEIDRSALTDVSIPKMHLEDVGGGKTCWSGCEWCVCVFTAVIWKTPIKAWKQHFVFCHERRAITNSLLFSKPQITFLTEQPGCFPGPTRPPGWGPLLECLPPLENPARQCNISREQVSFSARRRQQPPSGSSCNEKVDGVLESDTKPQIAPDAVGVWMLNSPGDPVRWCLYVGVCIQIYESRFLLQRSTPAASSKSLVCGR